MRTGTILLTDKARLEHSINSLLGILEGIAIDGLINKTEIAFLDEWCTKHNDVQHRHPFNELVPAVLVAIEDGAISTIEREDLKWLCEKLTAREFYTGVTADLQRLTAIIDGIGADGIINEKELAGLSDWLDEHSHLRRSWPYEEILSIVTGVLADGRIEATELKLLENFLAEVSAVGTSVNSTTTGGETLSPITGLCAVCPEVLFEGRTFCLSGRFSRFSSKELADKILAAGAQIASEVHPQVDYLIIGSDGNPCWTYACYGRQVENAVRLRQAGHTLLLVHENDLLDALSSL